MEKNFYTLIVFLGALIIGWILFIVLRRMEVEAKVPYIIVIGLLLALAVSLEILPGRVYVVDEDGHDDYKVTQYRVWGSYTVFTDSVFSESVDVPIQSVLLVNRTNDYPFVEPLLYGSDDFLDEDSLVYSTPQRYVLVPKATQIDYFPDEKAPDEISTDKSSEYKYHLQVFSLDEEMGTDHEH